MPNFRKGTPDYKEPSALSSHAQVDFQPNKAIEIDDDNDILSTPDDDYD